MNVKDIALSLYRGDARLDVAVDAWCTANGTTRPGLSARVGRSNPNAVNAALKDPDRNPKVIAAIREEIGYPAPAEKS